MVGCLVVVGAWLAGAVASSVEALGLMGFDEPRSQLVAALTFGSVAAAVATFVTGGRRVATLLGPAAWIALFGQTFAAETDEALRSTGLDGVFDPVGWSLSVVAFVVMSVVFAWAAATLALEARGALLRTAERVVTSIRGRAGRRAAIGRALGASSVAVVVLVALSVFALMIDYTPDTIFVRGAPPPVGLTGDTGDVPSTPPASASPSDEPGIGGDEGGGAETTPVPTLPGSTPAPAPSTGPQPVAIHDDGTLAVTAGTTDPPRGPRMPRAGASRLDVVTLPAPWTGGYANTVNIFVRLPVGYDPARERYPTVYASPNNYGAWVNGAMLPTTIDSLETTGFLPPMIYVFAPPVGGPHAVTECIDSADGRQRWDTFMSTTLVAWVDAHYPTIAEPAARTLMGSSQGAFCAANLLLRHPDVWHQSVSFVGYYDAAPRNRETHSGADVYGGDEALMDANSPRLLAPNVPQAMRADLFLVLLGNSSQAFYGSQLDGFTAVLDGAGFPRAVIQSPFGHSWKTDQLYLPDALEVIAARLRHTGVVR